MTNKTYLGIGETGPPGPPGPPGVGANWLGQWLSIRAYAQGDGVSALTADGATHLYVSQQDDNLGNDPTTDDDATWWVDITPVDLAKLNSDMTLGPSTQLAADAHPTDKQILLRQPLQGFNLKAGVVAITPRGLNAELRKATVVSTDKLTLTLAPQRSYGPGQTRITKSTREIRWAHKITDIRVTAMPDYSGGTSNPTPGTLQITIDAPPQDTGGSYWPAGGAVEIWGTKNYNFRRLAPIKAGGDASHQTWKLDWFGPFGTHWGLNVDEQPNPADWLIGTTYAIGALVRNPSDGLYYFSLASGNVGHRPNDGGDPGHWTSYVPSNLGSLTAGSNGYVFSLFNAVGETIASMETQATLTATGRYVLSRIAMPPEATAARIYGRAAGGTKHVLGTIPNIGHPVVISPLGTITGLTNLTATTLEEPIPAGTELMLSPDVNKPATIWTVQTDASPGDAMISVLPDRPAVWTAPADYDGQVDYMEGDEVTFLGLSYISLQDDNQGNQPDISTDWWSQETPTRKVFVALVDDGSVTPSGATPPTANTTGNFPAEVAGIDFALGDAWFATGAHRWFTRNFRPGEKFIISGSTNGNDGTYTVESVDPNGAWITVVEAFAHDEFDLGGTTKFTWNLIREHALGDTVMFIPQKVLIPELWGIKYSGDEGWAYQNALWDNASCQAKLWHPGGNTIQSSIPLFAPVQVLQGSGQSSVTNGINPLAWSGATAYRAGMQAADGGVYYVATADNTGQQPSSHPGSWSVVTPWADNSYGLLSNQGGNGRRGDLGRLFLIDMIYGRPPGKWAYALLLRAQQPCTWDGRVRINSGTGAGGEGLVFGAVEMSFPGVLEINGGRIGMTWEGASIVRWSDLDIERQTYAGIFIPPYSTTSFDNYFKMHSEESAYGCVALVANFAQVRHIEAKGYWAPGAAGSCWHNAPMQPGNHSDFDVDMWSGSSQVSYPVNDYDMAAGVSPFRVNSADVDRKVRYRKIGAPSSTAARNVSELITVSASGQVRREWPDQAAQPHMTFGQGGVEDIKLGPTGVVVLTSILYPGGVTDETGLGSPNGVLVRVRGSTFRRRDGAGGSTLYLNETGTNTWRAI